MFLSNFQGAEWVRSQSVERRLEDGFYFPDGFPTRYQARTFHVDQRARMTSSMSTTEASVSGLQSRVRSKPLRRSAIGIRHSVRRCGSRNGTEPHGAFIPRQADSTHCPIGYFCPDGACAFELLGLGLLAS